MALPELDEKANSIAFSTGIIHGWLSLEKAPQAVLEHMKTVEDGVDYWRQKYYQANEDLLATNGNYTKLTVSYAEMMQQMSLLKQQYDELLIETQKELHVENSI